MSNEKKWECPYCKADFPENLRSNHTCDKVFRPTWDGRGIIYDAVDQEAVSDEFFFCFICNEKLGFNPNQLHAGFEAGYLERESMLNYDEKFGACNWCADDVTEQAEGEVEITRLEALELLRKCGKRLDSCGIEDGWIIISDILQEFQEERV